LEAVRGLYARLFIFKMGRQKSPASFRAANPGLFSCSLRSIGQDFYIYIAGTTRNSGGTTCTLVILLATFSALLTLPYQVFNHLGPHYTSNLLWFRLDGGHHSHNAPGWTASH
jgi:hypothetical protein